MSFPLKQRKDIWHKKLWTYSRNHHVSAPRHPTMKWTAAPAFKFSHHHRNAVYKQDHVRNLGNAPHDFVLIRSNKAIMDKLSKSIRRTAHADFLAKGIVLFTLNHFVNSSLALTRPTSLPITK
jgi:hypothetical protein